MSRKAYYESLKTKSISLFNMVIDSDIRCYVPPQDKIKNFIELKNTVNSEQINRMEESVNTYLEQVKNSLPPLEKQVSPRFLRSNEVPFAYAPKTIQSSRRLGAIFNVADYYKPKQPKLSSNLEDTLVTQKFKEFVFRSKERMPKVLEEAKISPPPDAPDRINSRRRKKVYHRIPRCSKT